MADITQQQDEQQQQQPPKNRKERRAAAKQSGTPMSPPTSSPKFNLKMAQPDRSKPKGKTLLDIYEEKRAMLEQGQPFETKPDELLDESSNIFEAGLGSDEPIGPVGNAVFWSVLLAMMHFTFDVAVYHQYRQEMEWVPIVQRTFTVLPAFFVLVLMLRSDLANRLKTARQILYFAIAVCGGCYTIHVANRYGYYAVMKQAPPLGTLWVWSVIELDVAYGAASLAVNAAYAAWKGYSII